MSPRRLFDRVRDGDRRATGRDERERAARRHALEAHQRRGHRIEPAKIVEQPSVDARVRERALDVGQRFGSKHERSGKAGGSVERTPVGAPLARPFATSAATHVLDDADASDQQEQQLAQR